MQKTKKLNQTPVSARVKLASILTDGLLVDRNYLKNKGIERPLVDYYLRSGGLEAVGRGVYRRPGPDLKWQHVVYSLQVLNYAIYVGGRSALDHQGLAHYLPLGEKEIIHLYSANKLPAWLHEMKTNACFKQHSCSLFSKEAGEMGLTTLPFGGWDWPLSYATRERALIEYVDDLPNKAALEIADKYMESAITLRPDLLMSLLQACKRVKTKRLFLWLAQRHKHAWFSRLDIPNVELGSGKRVIFKEGVLDKQFNITVPSEYLDGGNGDGAEQPLF